MSNRVLRQDPIPGLDLFETTLIPFADLKRGPNPQRHGNYQLNALAVAFGQAVIHDMTKVRIGFAAGRHLPIRIFSTRRMIRCAR